MSGKEPGQFTFSEIYAQAHTASQTLARSCERSRMLASLGPLSQFDQILFTGCGSSYNLGRCAVWAWSSLLNKRVCALPAAELAHFPENYLSGQGKPLLFAISRTGGTAETVLAVETLHERFNAATVALTTEADRELPQVCHLSIDFSECKEQSLVMTQAFTCMLYSLYLLADSFSGAAWASQLANIPSAIGESLMRNEPVVRALGEDLSLSRFIFLGSGPFRGLAMEAALKMTEMAYETAQTYYTLEFRHGPKAALGPESIVIIYPVEAERRYLKVLIDEIAQTGARSLVIADRPVDVDCEQLNFNSGLGDLFLPALFAHIGQQLAFWRACARGVDPDAPRYLVHTVKLDGS